MLPAFADNYIYVLDHHAADGLWVVDPGDAHPVLDLCEKLSRPLTTVICTHHHPDHIGGIGELIQEFHPQVIVSRYDMKRIPGSTRAVNEGDRLHFADERIDVINVPGHTLGHIAYHFLHANWLF